MKNAFNPIEIGTRRTLYPSCIQIYKFPPPIYHVGGVPVLKRYLGQEVLTNPTTTTTLTWHAVLLLVIITHACIYRFHASPSSTFVV